MTIKQPLVIPALFCALSGLTAHAQTGDRPNVIIVLTDDQGYGDLSCHGNTVIRTPAIDNFYTDAVRLTNFHVSPTCAPTRSALMTGHYTNRTGCWHTIAGRSQLFEEETTMAEVFATNGYATGMFGKWHLGDNYPFRPQDRGFQEVVRHGGGGITQGPDLWGNDYFDDRYWHNDSIQQYKGYCTDVFFSEALRFIRENKDRNFFCYIATNAPHSPLHLPENYYKQYSKENLPNEQKRFYGMISNIDDNFAALEKALDDLGISENTILIFMTDNGTASGYIERNGTSYGYNAGMRGKKGSSYEGGHRVPFFIRWNAGNLAGGRDINRISAHIDVLPTLQELCGLHGDPDSRPDGISLVPLFYNTSENWPERSLIVDSQRLQNIVKWKSSAVMDDHWRLINGTELYNMDNDPGQEKDIAGQYPETVGRLRESYEKWWLSLDPDRLNSTYAYIRTGTPYETVSRISAHDMHTGILERAWHQYGALTGSRARGVFKIAFSESGEYLISLRRYPEESQLAINQPVEARPATLEINNPMPGSTQLGLSGARLVVGNVDKEKKSGEDDRSADFKVHMEEGKYDMEAYFTDKAGIEYPAYYIYIRKL